VRTNATFREFAGRTAAAARQLYGAGSTEVNAVEACWDGVGVSAL
jgi:Zn-dependent metalloprotease